jgi:hypothetical protein
MATSNFYSKNASKIFATDFDEQEFYDEFKINLSISLEEVADKSKTISFSPYGNDDDELRSYPSDVIGQLYASREYDMGDDTKVEVMVNVNAVVRSGYYSGCNLDYCYNFQVDNSTFSNIDDTVDYLENYGSRAMAEYKAGFATKFLSKTLDEIVEKMEEVFSQYTDSYVVTARFSNGETIYEKVDK